MGIHPAVRPSDGGESEAPDEGSRAVTAWSSPSAGKRRLQPQHRGAKLVVRVMRRARRPAYGTGQAGEGGRESLSPRRRCRLDNAPRRRWSRRRLDPPPGVMTTFFGPPESWQPHTHVPSPEGKRARG